MGLQALLTQRLNKCWNMKNYFKIIIAALSAVALASCSEWTETESVGVETVYPWEQEPELWAEYKAAMQAYKAGAHSLVYVRFENSPEGTVNEKGYMRCLPDSLDIVSLTNAENFSAYDAEDMQWMKSVGTKVLYQIDLVSDETLLYNSSALTAALDKAVSTVLENGMDGFSLTGAPKDDGGATQSAAAEVVNRLAAAGEGLMIVFEGNPAFIPEGSLDKIDLFALATETIENPYDLRNCVLDAVEHGVTKDKMLLSADFNGAFYDSDNAEVNVLEAMASQMTSLGPMAGLALYNIEQDYYDYDGNWLTLRSVISRINP